VTIVGGTSQMLGKTSSTANIGAAKNLPFGGHRGAGTRGDHAGLHVRGAHTGALGQSVGAPRNVSRTTRAALGRASGWGLAGIYFPLLLVLVTRSTRNLVRRPPSSLKAGGVARVPATRAP